MRLGDGGSGERETQSNVESATQRSSVVGAWLPTWNLSNVDAPAPRGKRPKINDISALPLAPALLFGTSSGGFSGPARRSGVPLEQPPFHILPAWLQGESKGTPCPAMYALR